MKRITVLVGAAALLLAPGLTGVGGARHGAEFVGELRNCTDGFEYDILVHQVSLWAPAPVVDTTNPDAPRMSIPLRLDFGGGDEFFKGGGTPASVLSDVVTCDIANLGGEADQIFVP